MKLYFKGKKQASDTFRLGLLLSMVGGFTDAYTFVTRGKVLANAQTGNIVFFGLRLVEKKWEKAFFYFLPIFAYIMGIIIAEYIRIKFKNSKFHWRQIILIIEIIVLFICGFVPMGNLDVFVNISISFMCSLQVQAFRKTNGNVSATTMCTGNLRSGTENLFYFITKKDKNVGKNSLIYFGLIFFFIMGAIMGSFFSEWIFEKAILVACLILLSVFFIMFREKI
ncbi:MAG: YoaK family protein [Leptotrichiaceae bacterium]|nr:YoaK family protein [Leptotrichiaceae bacterium]